MDADAQLGITGIHEGKSKSGSFGFDVLPACVESWLHKEWTSACAEIDAPKTQCGPELGIGAGNQIPQPHPQPDQTPL